MENSQMKNFAYLDAGLFVCQTSTLHLRSDHSKERIKHYKYNNKNFIANIFCFVISQYNSFIYLFDFKLKFTRIDIGFEEK